MLNKYDMDLMYKELRCLKIIMKGHSDIGNYFYQYLLSKSD